jgi:hypothetical protein
MKTQADVLSIAVRLLALQFDEFQVKYLSKEFQ